jgi:predicted phosphodiesterase
VDDIIGELLAVPEPPERTPRRMDHPKGWEPGVVFDPTSGSGSIIVQSDDEPDPAIWEHLIADWGLDPKRCAIVPGSVQIRAWDVNAGEGEIKRLRYYRASIVARTSAVDRADVDALCAEVMKRRPAKPVTVEGERALIVCLSDWQLGKGEGDGSRGTMQRILDARDTLVARIKELKRVGRAPSVIYLVGLGDLVEGCAEHYASQTFTVDLDRAQQTRVVRRLILAYVDSVIDLAPRIVLAAVPGNHGENRKDGKAFTSVATDNDDLTTVETVGEILSANPDRYGHVSVVLAQEYTLALDVCGVVVAWSHGHTARKSGHAAAVMEDWWRGQVMGRQGISDADILVAGHRHHLVVSESTGRTFLQCPAMDPGSAWFTASTGSHSPSGLLTFMVGRETYGQRGWGDLAVL